VNTIDFFHHVIRTESAVFVADVESFGQPYAENALRRGIEILEGRLKQLRRPVASATDSKTELASGSAGRSSFSESAPVVVAETRPEKLASPAPPLLVAVPSPPLIPKSKYATSRGVTIQVAEAVVAEAFGVPIAWFHSGKRETRFTWPTQVAMYVAYRVTEASMPHIGRYFGKKHHTTVMYARDKVEDLVARGKAGVDVEAMVEAAKAAMRPLEERVAS
jgi:Bacterial dnaA protein helix-turn-helix